MLTIDVWSDIACPWCYLGKRRLTAALAATGVPSEVMWHAFELAPDLPPEGALVETYLGKRFSKAQIDQMHARMTAMGKADDIDFQFDKRTRMANTRMGHRAIRIAHDLGGAALQDKVVEACFRANFTDGVDLSNREALLGALAPTGIDIEVLRTRLTGNDALSEVIADEEAAKRMGISGVPTFIAGGKLAMSGAQPADVFRDFLAQARSAVASA